MPDADAEHHLVKAELVSELKPIIDRRGWTQTQAAKVMGMAQSDVSCLLRGPSRPPSLPIDHHMI